MLARPKLAPEACAQYIPNCNRCGYRARADGKQVLYCLGCVKNWRIVTASNSCGAAARLFVVCVCFGVAM
jgi:hypothetical protein